MAKAHFAPHNHHHHITSLTPDIAMSISDLLVQKLSEKATVPTRGSAQAAGYDLYRSVYAVGLFVGSGPI